MASAASFHRMLLRPFLLLAAVSASVHVITLIEIAAPQKVFAKEQAKAEEEETDAPSPPPVDSSPNAGSDAPEQVDLGDIDGVKKELLENLNTRRKELEEWSRSIALKENVLNATEIKINRKLEELRAIKIEVEKILSLYEEKERSKIGRMVKIYENMKPRDAGRIFNQMDNELLMDILSNMREQKAAPILAAMDTAKVSYITARLLERRRLNYGDENN